MARKKWAFRLCAAVLTFLAAEGRTAAAAGPPLALADLEGTWVSSAALRSVETTRSAHSVALQNVEIAPPRPGEALGHLAFSNGRERSWRAVREVEGKGDTLRIHVGPWEKKDPGPKEWTRFRAIVGRDASGRPATLTFTEKSFKESLVDLPLERVGTSLATHLNRLLLAGSYLDGSGRTWEFSEGQQARWPDHRFPYEISIDAAGADCPYITSPDRTQPGGEMRWGYSWEGDTLLVYRIAYDSLSAVIHCEVPPYALLKRAPPRK
jgi:hypothetical protein